MSLVIDGGSGYFHASMVWCFVLVNGCLGGFFHSARGLRHGHPSSPPLFIIFMEAFSRMLERARRGNYISVFSVGGPSSGQLEISSLLWGRYVDFLWSRSRANLAFGSSVSVVSVHRWFENKIGKSELVPVGDVLNVDALAGILWFKVAKWDIWREGNVRTFERNERSIYDLKPSFFQLCLKDQYILGPNEINFNEFFIF